MFHDKNLCAFAGASQLTTTACTIVLYTDLGNIASSSEGEYHGTKGLWIHSQLDLFPHSCHCCLGRTTAGVVVGITYVLYTGRRGEEKRGEEREGRGR